MGNILDLCFCNLEPLITKTLALTTEDKYHPALSICIDFHTTLTPKREPSFIFNKADFNGLNCFFYNTNWAHLYAINNLDDKIRYFYSMLNEGISQYVPVYSKGPSSFPQWFSRDLIELIKQKKAAHLNYKKTSSSANYRRFSDLRQSCKELGITCYKIHLEKVEGAINQNTRKF